MERRSWGGVLIFEVSRIPTKDCCSVLGIGVAVKVRTSTRFFSRRMCSLCFTPKRCSSSTINSPRFSVETSSLRRLCVPTKTSIFLLCSRSRIKACSFFVRNRDRSSTFTPNTPSRFLHVM